MFRHPSTKPLHDDIREQEAKAKDLEEGGKEKEVQYDSRPENTKIRRRDNVSLPLPLNL